MMIASSMGLGHVCRALAVMEEFDADVEIELAVHDRARKFVELHRQFWGCKVRLHRLVYNHRAHFVVHEEHLALEPTEVQCFITDNAEALEFFGDCDVLVNDWIPLGAGVSRSALGVGLYHSPLAPDPSDDRIVTWWKHQQILLANHQDVFVHMTPWGRADPSPVPVRTALVRVPLITRRAKISEMDVRAMLRIPAGVPYVVMYGGDRPEDVTLHHRVSSCVEKVGRKMILVSLDREIPANAIYGHDVIRHAALVIAKPGMSILAECFAAGVPQVLLADKLPERRLKQVLVEQVLGAPWPAIDVDGLEEGISLALARSKEWRTACESLDFTGAAQTALILQRLATQDNVAGSD
jgi:hypothetical protein